MMQVKDENDHIDESGTLEALPTNRQREKRGSSGVKTKWSQPASRLEVASSTMPKHGKASVDAIAVPETKQMRKTQKILTSKVS